MAMTVSASIQLNDLMSGPITHIMSAIDVMCSHMERVDAAIGAGFDTSDIFEVRQHIDMANAELLETTERLDKIKKKTDEVANSAQNAVKGASGWSDKIAKIGAGYLSLRAVAEGVKFTAGYSDNLTQNTNRLNLMNDGTQSTESLQQDIYGAAMSSRADLSDTMSTVAGLGQRAGEAFNGNGEVIQFVENLNKQFAIAGATQEEQASATLQLTQALGSGVLRGEELNAVFESAPNVIQTIADYLDVPIGRIREMAAEGEITADIVKSAMLGATSEINEEFSKTSATWEQNLTMLGNKAYMAFQPLGEKINEIANSPTMQALFENIGNALVTIAIALTWILDIISSVGGFIVDNWDLISPFVGVVTAIMAMYFALNIVNSTISLCQKAVAAFGVVWATCPVLAVIALIIGALYFVVAIINRVTDKSYSATGIICGGVSTVWAVIWNVAMAIADLIMSVVNIFINVLKTAGNFLANVFVDPVASVIYLFRDMANTVLSFLQSIASSMDKIFGTNSAYDIGNWMQWVDDKAEKLVNELSPDSSYGKVFNIETYTAEDLFGVNRLGYYDTYMRGYNWGANLFNFDGKKDRYDEYGFNPDKFKDLLGGMDATAKNTKDIADNTAKATSLLDLVRDNMEREAIAKYTSSNNIIYDWSGMTNNYNNAGEAFDFVSALADYLKTKKSISTEGI